MIGSRRLGDKRFAASIEFERHGHAAALRYFFALPERFFLEAYLTAVIFSRHRFPPEHTPYFTIFKLQEQVVSSRRPLR
jgi:hypothetical protein